MAEKKSKWLIPCDFCIFRQFDPVGAITTDNLMFNNGGRLLSSVLLFLYWYLFCNIFLLRSTYNMCVTFK